MDRLLVVAIVSLWAAPAWSAQDLLATYEQALRNDPELLSAQAEVGAAEARYRQARGRLLPQLSATASYTQVTQSQEFEGGGGEGAPGAGFFRPDDGETTSDQESYTLNLTQPLFNWTAWQNKDAAAARSVQARTLLSQAEQDLIVRAAQAYFDVLAARDALDATREQQAAIQRQLDRAEAAFQAGLEPITDRQEAQSSLDSARVDAIAATNTRANARDTLIRLTGRAPGQLADVAVDERAALEADKTRSRDAWTARAMNNSLAVRAAQAALVAARQNVSAQSGGHFPDVALVGRVGRSEQLFPIGVGGQATIVSDTQSVGVQLEMPLFSGGTTSAQVDEPEYLAEQARLDVIAARRQLRVDINSSWRNVRASAERVAALDRAIASGRTALEAARAGYTLGTRTILDVIEAEIEVTRRKVERKQAWYDFAVAQLQLRQAAGVLDLDALARINAHLARTQVSDGSNNPA